MVRSRLSLGPVPGGDDLRPDNSRRLLQPHPRTSRGMGAAPAPAPGRRVKIAYVTPSYHPAYVYGGPTYSALGLSTALARIGCEVRVLTTDANGRQQTLDTDTTSEIDMEPRLRVRYCHRVALESDP